MDDPARQIASNERVVIYALRWLVFLPFLLIIHSVVFTTNNVAMYVFSWVAEALTIITLIILWGSTVGGEYSTPRAYLHPICDSHNWYFIFATPVAFFTLLSLVDFVIPGSHNPWLVFNSQVGQVLLILDLILHLAILFAYVVAVFAISRIVKAKRVLSQSDPFHIYNDLAALSEEEAADKELCKNNIIYNDTKRYARDDLAKLMSNYNVLYDRDDFDMVFRMLWRSVRGAALRTSLERQAARADKVKESR